MLETKSWSVIYIYFFIILTGHYREKNNAADVRSHGNKEIKRNSEHKQMQK